MKLNGLSKRLASPLGQISRKLIHDQNEPFNFKYYLIVARTYHLSSEELDNLGQNFDRTKRRKGQVSMNDIPRSFHPEDQQFQQVGMLFHFRHLSFRVRGIGIGTLHPLSLHERSTEGGGCLRA